MKYYLDSNIFIYSVTKEEVGEKARKVIEKIEQGKINAATSVLTLDEVLWIVQQETDRETAIETGRKLLKMENLEILESNIESGAKSLKIMENTDLDPRDSIHIATAQKHGIYTFVTEDGDMEKLEIENIDTETLLERAEDK